MTLSRLQTTLTAQMALAGLASALVGWIVRAPEWGLSAALGFWANAAYFWLLRVQVDRMVGRERRPGLLMTMVSVLGRQVVCLLAFMVAFLLWGSAWWLCLGAIVLGRNWAMIVNHTQGTLTSEAC
ncbi:hypothetical protein D3C86_1260650 [compost metagenome]